MDPPAQHSGGGGGFWLQLPDLQLSQTQVDNYMLSPADLSSVLWIRDPVPFLTPGDPGWKKSRSGIRNEHPRSFIRELRNSFFGLKIHKFFDANPDPGWKNSDAGSAKLFFIIHSITPAKRNKKACDLDSVCTVQAKFQRIYFSLFALSVKNFTKTK